MPASGKVAALIVAAGCCLGPSLTGLDWRLRSDGSISISAPAKVGDWAVQFFPQWTGECLKGDGTAYGRIKVR